VAKETEVPSSALATADSILNLFQSQTRVAAVGMQRLNRLRYSTGHPLSLLKYTSKVSTQLNRHDSILWKSGSLLVFQACQDVKPAYLYIGWSVTHWLKPHNVAVKLVLICFLKCVLNCLFNTFLQILLDHKTLYFQ
jgi:hypothetical protein